MILIHSVELSTALVNPNEVVDKKPLLRKLNDFPDIGPTPPPFSGRVKIGEWLQSLAIFNTRLEDWLSELDETEAGVRRVRKLVVDEDFNAAQLEFTRQDDLWLFLEGSYQRTRDEVFTDEVKERLDQIESVDSLIDTDDDGDFVVDVGDGRSTLFVWSGYQPTARKNAAKILARRCALALATKDKQALLAMIDYVRQEIPRLKSISTDLNKSIEDTLSEYQHIVVTALLINAGRLEYLVDSQARLVVNMKGYPSRRQRPGRARDETLAENVVLDMVVESLNEEKNGFSEMMQQFMKESVKPYFRRGRNGQPPNVIAIGPQNPTLVRLISEQRLNEIQQSDELIRTYDGGERHAYVILSTIKPRQTEPQVWYSETVPFRDVIRQAELPEKKS